MSKLKQLKEGDNVYRITKAGLILQISTIIGTTENLAMSKDYEFVKEYASKTVKCLNFGTTKLTRFSIETQKLKIQWQKQMMVSQIMMLLDSKIELRVLEDIYKLLKK